MLFEAAKFRSRASDAFARRIDIGLYLDSSMVAEIYKANGIQASQSRTLHRSPVVACMQSIHVRRVVALLFDTVGAGSAAG